MGFHLKKKIFNNFEKMDRKIAKSVLFGELPTEGCREQLLDFLLFFR